MSKVLALYLPQYYETEYNNNWWGEGYTEWTACKRSKPLFKGHYQPRIPYNNNYYDLTNLNDIKSQIDMAKKYGVDGFSIYHYYSRHQKLLEKPTEIILNNKELDINFCLNWANHDWKKLWFGQDETVLWKQEYGGVDDWKLHFEYCLQFFKDDRYVKVDNKPVFFIYASWHFEEVNLFIESWNIWAKEVGFDGIYFVKTIDSRNNEQKGRFNATFYREPFCTFSHSFSKRYFIKRYVKVRFAKKINKLLDRYNVGVIGDKFSYDRTWEYILKRKLDSSVIPGAFCDWDNSARKRYNSHIAINANPEKFEIYFSKLYKNSVQNKVPFIVINAWNEWAEGAYLEPDEKYGFQYLEAIKKAKS